MQQKEKEAFDLFGLEIKFYFFLHNLYLQTVWEAENLLGSDECENLLQFVIHWDLINCILRNELPHEVSLCSGSQSGTDGKHCSRLLV